MPDRPERLQPAGRTLVRRGAIAEVVRAAVLGSYGVTGLTAPSALGRLFGRLRAGEPGIRIGLRPALEVDVYLTVAYGVPVAEVARQVDFAIRWSLRRALGGDVGRVSIHVDGMTGGPYSTAGAAPRVEAGDRPAGGGPVHGGPAEAAGLSGAEAGNP